MSQTCPSCNAPASGRFCPQCGVAIDAECRECRNPLPAGARFCNQCGVSVSATAAPARPRQAALPWAIAGVAVAVLLATTVLPRLSGDDVQAPAPLAQQTGDPTQVDLASMTPRQAADRLFNRVMQGVSAGNDAEVGRFAPMAIQAYGMVPERDADLHYHLGELYRVTGSAPAARAQADSILATDPSHLFGLYGAARAEELRGDANAARAMYRRFLDAYATEVARNLPEYQEHAQGLPSMRAAAQQAAGS